MGCCRPNVLPQPEQSGHKVTQSPKRDTVVVNSTSPPIRPHHGRAHQLTLVTSAGKDCVQVRSADLPGTARRCLSVPAAVYSSRRHPVPTKTSVFHLGRSVRSCRQTAYCWTSCFLRRWRSCLERSSCRRHFSTFSVHFPKMFKTASFPLSYPGLVL